jgi:KDO2-lipid IV(A) lauroyltransferase
MPILKTIKYFFEAIIIYSFFIIIKLIGIKNSRRLFSKIFTIFGPLIKSTNIINHNLAIAFKFNEKQNNNQIINNMWSNYGMTFVEYLYLSKFKKDSSHIKIKGLEILENIIKNKKRVIFVSGHFANFELMSMELVKAGINLATIYRPLNNFFINPFMEKIRKKFICENQIKKGISGMRLVINYLKKNYSIALMIDQRVSEGIRLPFFNKKAYTTTVPAQLALKYNCNIVPVSIKRMPDNKFEMNVFDPIKLDRSDDIEKDKINISLRLNSKIEEIITKNPDQWIWTHNRWK